MSFRPPAGGLELHPGFFISPMLYLIGIMFAIAGVFMFIRCLVLTRRPKVYDARVKNVFKDFWEHPKYPGKVGPRQVKQASIEYFYQSQKYEVDIIPKTRSLKPGDTLAVIVNTETPRLTEEYRPTVELLMASVITAVGLGIVVTCHLILDHYDAW